MVYKLKSYFIIDTLRSSTNKESQIIIHSAINASLVCSRMWNFDDINLLALKIIGRCLPNGAIN